MAWEWTDQLDRIDWHALSALYAAAPLGQKDPGELKTAFTNSRYRCFVFDSSTLIGVGRAVADGVDASYLCDIAVLPSHQGRGLGKEIISRLIAMSRGHNKIILYAAPGKESLYREFGFKPMTTAMALFEDQPGAVRRGLVRDD